VPALTAGTTRDPPVLVLSRCSRPDSGTDMLPAG